MADPATAAGLALAAIPLLISAFENYEITFQPFVTYYRHVKEVERFLARLGIPRTIFLNECELLFMAVSNGSTLSEVLRDPHHPSRNDGEMSKRLQDLLGSSYNTCFSTLQLINETLSKITLETEDFESLLGNKVCLKDFNLKRTKVWIHFMMNSCDMSSCGNTCYCSNIHLTS
jgi:hypothetical protein